MKRLTVFLMACLLLASSCSGQKDLPEWALGPFTRPAEAGGMPVISPNPEILFDCPMKGTAIRWQESDTFNPAAVIKDGKINVLFRSEDNTATGIGSRTSRIGLAVSSDGINMDIDPLPVLFPQDDFMKEYDWPGGCEDPRVAMTEDGLYVMMYTSWNRKVPRLCVATSRDLKTWTKHGYVFQDVYDGRFNDMACKSGSVLTELKDGKLVISKYDGKYLMYWGESMVNIAWSDDLIHWTPEVDENGRLLGVLFPRDGYFDSSLTECGPPALRTKDGIILMYNGKNRPDSRGSRYYPSGTYSAGQALFSADDPHLLLDRLDKPFFVPELPFEKSGQYRDGTVFIEGLVRYKHKWYLYYGCADSYVGVATSK